MTEPLLEVKNLTKIYGQKKNLLRSGNQVLAVNNVSFTVNKGETFGIVGESGSGKTTIGRMIMQLVNHTNGDILYKGQKYSEFTKESAERFKSKVQIIFQDSGSAFNPRKTIGSQIAYPLLKKIKDRKAVLDEVIKFIEMVGLSKEMAYRYPHELSGGQRQRAGIARALILKPELLVLDEPVSALDVSVKSQIINLLENLQKKYNLTYIFIAHNLDLVAYFCDRIAVMYHGEIKEVGSTKQIYQFPHNPITKKLLSSILTLDGRYKVSN
ncbi:ATP-binding cassette domain-containing protein [Terrilactibacillus laevilacticus]|uniref:ATP-binding cassette domain-containing protein n=1 Tax=Terrilactibacillus laevilacticus TaxID=1380157 RepID=A0ABW5PKE3_9BACI|nr:ATP-binding cassette domain-containing protein [Terrilactibacillus laevilacticus]